METIYPKSWPDFFLIVLGWVVLECVVAGQPTYAITPQASQATSAEYEPYEATPTELRKLCGSLSLYSVAKYHRLNVTFQEIKALLPPSEQGTSMLELKQAAESIGFLVRAIEMRSQDILLFANPLIARATQPGHEAEIGHFLVLIPVSSKKGCWILDPPKRAKWASIPTTVSEPSARIEVLLLKPVKRIDRQPATHPNEARRHE